jgi:acyl carrier protein
MVGEADIYSALTEIFNEVFMREDLVLTPALSSKDVKGWDSFKYVEIIIAAQEHFGIRLHTRDLDKLQNVGDLATAIAEKLATK